VEFLFNAGSLILTAANFSSIGSIVNVGSISGTGVLDNEGQQFVVSGNLAAQKFILVNGLVQSATANINTFDIQSGTFNITGSGATVSSLTWEGGLITSPSTTASTTLNVATLTLTGTQPKTLSNIKATVTNLALSCGTQQCQLFTQNASLNTKSQTGQSVLKHTPLLS